MAEQGALILVVEDESATLSLIRRVLAHEGFSVLDATTGEKGLELYGQHRPDLIILDIILPQMDGFQVCKALRERDELVPILMLTCKGKDSDKIHGFSLGADDYVVKPFNPGELIARVQAILRRTRETPEIPDAVDYRGVRLEFRTRKCFKSGAEVDLTPTEFTLLAALLSSPNQVITRESLATRLWGERHHVSAKSLDVYVSRLRDKLKDDEEPPLIRTERGIGYLCG